jgi:hypothetical protein
MSDFTVKSDSVDVEHIMRQVRSRIREKRGVDYTEDEIRELASVKLERFLDPKGVRSDLLEQYRKHRETAATPPNYSFEDSTVYDSSRPLLRWIRKLLNPILKLFFNPAPIAQALHVQSKLNEAHPLYYELIHNLVLETTRLSIEVKNLKMRVESMSSRLDFDERRARALEGVVQYRPGTVAPLQPPAGGGSGGSGSASGVNATLSADEAERRSRRRRRRGRRRPGGPGPGPGGERSGPSGAGGHESGRADGGESSGPSGETGNGPAES